MNLDNHFYVELDKERVFWLFYDPKGGMNGQFVCNEFTGRQLADAIKICTDRGEISVFDYLGRTCRQFRANKGTGLFNVYQRKFDDEPTVSGCTAANANLMSKYFEAMELINEFCMTEFGTKGDFSNLKRISVAYTFYPEEMAEIQVYVNLVDFEIETQVNHERACAQKYNSLEELISLGLNNISFDDITYVPSWMIREILQDAENKDSRQIIEPTDIDLGEFRNMYSLFVDSVGELECWTPDEDLLREYDWYDAINEKARAYYNQHVEGVEDRESEILGAVLCACGKDAALVLKGNSIALVDDEGTFAYPKLYSRMVEKHLTKQDIRWLEGYDYNLYADLRDLMKLHGIDVRNLKSRGDNR